MPIEFKNINGAGNFTLVNNTNSGNIIFNNDGSTLIPTPPPTTAAPTAAPTTAPTAAPTAAPTTTAPTTAPTAAPTTAPTAAPTAAPTTAPTAAPTTTAPTVAPTPAPTSGIKVTIVNLFEGNNSSTACVINNNRAPDAYTTVATLSENAFTVGKQWYVDFGLTTPYPTGYYADLSSSSGNYRKWVRIDASGIVAEVGSCL